MACWLEYHNSHECGSQYRDSCEWQEKLADISRGKFSVLVGYWGGGGCCEICGNVKLNLAIFVSPLLCFNSNSTI